MSIRKVSIIFSHWQTFRWTAIAVHFLKKYQWPLPWELLIADNSPGHPSIRVLTETSLGEGVKIIQGEPDFPSHGRGNELCLHHIDPESTHVFFSESDAFPIQDNWAEAYIKAVGEGYDLIGPEIPQGSGKYIHPAGSLYNRQVFGYHQAWRDKVQDWYFCPDAAIELGTSDRPYHVVAHKDFLLQKNLSEGLQQKINLWRRAECMQEMRCFDEETFSNYMLRTGITNWLPTSKLFYNKIGFEAGQHLAYFTQSQGLRCLKAPTDLQWMRGHQGGQAAYSDVFGGFRHCWCGTSSRLSGIAPDVRAFKLAQEDLYFLQLPEDIRKFILNLEAESA
jgi:hypothetical protein